MARKPRLEEMEKEQSIMSFRLERISANFKGKPLQPFPPGSKFNRRSGSKVQRAPFGKTADLSSVGGINHEGKRWSFAAGSVTTFGGRGAAERAMLCTRGCTRPGWKDGGVRAHHAGCHRFRPALQIRLAGDAQ